MEVRSYFTYLMKNNLLYIKDNQAVDYKIDPVNFIYYMIVGLFIGCIAIFILFKQRTIKNKIRQIDPGTIS